MDAEGWNARYRASELVWGAGPNRWVERDVSGLEPARALDLACGEGRNALWLAARGWQVTAVDFSSAALQKARRLEGEPHRVRWQEADATAWVPERAFELVLLAYLHLEPAGRAQVLGNAVAGLVPGGRILVIGHDRSNLDGGVGGPQDPAVLYTPEQIVHEVQAADPSITVEVAEVVERPVDGSAVPALDNVVRARRAAPADRGSETK